MRDQPTGDQLLEAARAVLRDELVALLPADKRHEALMIANAMAVAIRQFRNGDEHERQELSALRRLLGQDEMHPLPHGADLVGALVDANRTLCGWIRDGRADDGDLCASVWAHLGQVARARVLESNPKYLEANAR
jgi:hypothetical protein